MEPILCKHCGGQVRKVKWSNMSHISFWIHQTVEEARTAYNNPLTDRERFNLRYCRTKMAEPVGS